MDVNDYRILVTVVSLILFIGICVWTYRRSHQDAFAQAAALPFMDSTPANSPQEEKQ